MGWTEYGRSERIDPKAECDRLCTWSNDSSSARVVASSLVGSVYYAAVERTNAGEPPYVFGAVFLIHRSPFAYKDMDEGMGPCESACPKYILEKLSPLPPRDPQPCSNCAGTGKIQPSPNVREDCWGSECYICDGAGERDRHDHARGWRERCWKQFGGEPQGYQLLMPV